MTDPVDTSAEAMALLLLELDLADQPLASNAAAILRALLAERDALREAVRGVLHWADRKCPCHNDLPDPCPLCGASVEGLERCKAADETLPRALLAQARAALTGSNGNG